MSSKIDERVVEMRFDNKQFESGVKTSMNTIDKLKESLNFTGASKGLENISAAAKNVNMSTLSGAVETVRTRFSALEVMAMTALANITNSAINAGKNLVNTFAIEPVTTGFQEFEQKMGSVQTIMASTGASLDEVNKYLEELNTYSDKTIYSFSDMTNSIGKFTNAGVKLDDAVMAIKGISNEAAVSGANANEASRAMYNFAQALSAGSVKLIDWKSIENANMATVEFKEQLLETAVAVGTVEKTADGMYKVLTKNNQGSTMEDAISSTKNFNDSLSYQWMTTDVLIKTLRDYADETTDIGKKAYASAQDVKTFSMMMDTLKEAAQSGWAQTWELIVGDFEEGKTLWTELSNFFGDFIAKSADARNSLLSGALDSKWEQFTDKINKAGISTDAFTEKLKGVASGHNINLDKLIEKYGSLGAVIAKGKISGDMIIETIEKFTGVTSEASGGWSNLSETVAQVVRGDFGNGQERIEALTKAGYDNAIVQDLVNKTYAEMGNQWGTYEEVCEAASKVIGEQAENFENMSDAQLESMGYTEDQIKAFRSLAEEAKKTGTPLNELIMNLSKPSGRELLISSLMNILKGLVKIISTVKEAWQDIFPPVTSERLYSIIERFHSLTEGLLLNTTETKQLKTAFKGLFGILDVLSSIVTGTLTRGFDFLSGLWEKSGIDILGVASTVGKAALAFRDWFYENELLNKGLDVLFGGLSKGVTVLGNWFNKFKELPIVQESIAKIKDEFAKFQADPNAYFNGMVTAVKGLIDEIKNMPIISQIISTVKQSISDFEDSFKTNFPEIYAWCEELISRFKSIDTLTLDDVTTAFQNAKNAIKEFIDSIGTFFGSFKENAAKPFNEAGEEIESFRDRVVGIVDSIKSKMPKINWVAVLSIGAGAGIFTLATKLVNTISSLAEPIKNFSELIGAAKEAMENVGKGIQGALKSFSDSVKANVLIKIAAAIAILAGSIFLLAQLDTGQLAAAVIALGVLAGGLMALSKVFGKIGGFDKGSVSMVAIAASVLILVGALKMMESLDISSLPATLLLLASVVGTLIAAIVLLDKFAPNFSASAVSLLAIAVSIKILVGALIDIGSAQLSFTGSTIAALLVAIGGLALIAAAAGKVKMGSAATLLAIPIALKLFVSALNDIANFDTDMIKDNIGKFVEIFGMFGALMLASKLAGNNAAKVGVMFLGISASLLLMTGAMAMIASIDPSGLKRATNTIDQILAMFAIITAASGLSGGNAAKAGVMFMGMSAAILILVGAIALLGELDPGKMEQGLAAIGVLSLIFAGLMAVSKLAGDATKTIIVLGVVVGGLAVALGALSLLDPGRLSTATAALSIVMLAFTALFGVLGLVSKFTSVGASSIVALASVMVVVGLLAGVLYALSALNVQSSIENAVALSALLLAVSGACLILSAVGKAGTAAVSGAISLVGVVAVIGGFIIAVGALTELFPEAERFVDEGIPLLEKIAYGIGSVISNFATGLVGGGLPKLGASLSKFMVNLLPFLITAKFVDASIADNIGALVKAILMITGAELVNSIASFFTGDNALGLFATDLSSFADALKKFSNKAKGIEKDPILKAAEAATALATLLDAVPNSGGALAALIGDNTWTSFSDGLVGFGEALKGFSDSVADIDDTVAANITRSAEAATALATLLDAVPNSGGYIAKFTGENSWSSFSVGLEDFGKALKTYSESVAGIDDTVAANITRSAEASTALADLLEVIPKSGGLSGFIFGDSNWTDFSTGLAEFGAALKSYADSVAGMDDTSVEHINKSIEATNALVTLKNSLGTEGGILEFFIGKKETFESFGTDLGTFADSFTGFFEKSKGIKVGRLTAITNAVTGLASVQKIINDCTSISFAAFGYDIDLFGGYLKSFSEKLESVSIDDLTKVTAEINSMVDLVSKMNGLDTSGIDSFTSATDTILSSLATSFSFNADSVASEMTSAAETMMKGFVDGALSYLGHEATKFDDAGEELAENLAKGSESGEDGFTDAYEYLASVALVAIANTHDRFISAGGALTENLASGITSKVSVVLSSIQSMTSRAANAIKTYQNSFYSAGSYLVSGFANGISENTWRAEAKAKAMAGAAADAAKKELDENSPSKVFYKIGDFAGLGFVNALYDSTKKSTKAGKELGNSARKGLGSTISMLSDTVADELNTEPVIRPVLDLSDVESRANDMNRMLTLTPAAGISNNIRAISSSMNSRQNGTNNDIIAAIEKLAANTTPASGDTYIVNGITYDDGSNVVGAVRDLIRAARIERRA